MPIQVDTVRVETPAVECRYSLGIKPKNDGTKGIAVEGKKAELGERVSRAVF
jgi:hypothetical protein